MQLGGSVEFLFQPQSGFLFLFLFLIILSSSVHWPPDAKSLLIGKDHDAKTD